MGILRLRKQFSYAMIKSLSDELFKCKKIECKLNAYRSVQICTTHYDEYGYTDRVNIGFEEIEHAKRSFPHVINPYISDKVFATVILNMYHEHMHCIQKNDLFRQKHMDPYTSNQLVQEIACMDNHDYYFDNGNYKINANEIQAEQYGIINAYQYLCDEFPEINPTDHEHIILDIVNDKMLNSTYFVSSPTPFKSLSEVEKAFDDAYDNSFTKKRTYMVNSSNTHDAVKLFMREHPEAKESYLNADSPLEQDRCIAAINLKLHPEWLEAYPALSDMDLSYENIIKKPYQQTQASHIKKIHSMFGDVLADHRSDNEFEI